MSPRLQIDSAASARRTIGTPRAVTASSTSAILNGLVRSPFVPRFSTAISIWLLRVYSTSLPDGFVGIGPLRYSLQEICCTSTRDSVSEILQPCREHLGRLAPRVRSVKPVQKE